jgi:hypothetical protein
MLADKINQVPAGTLIKVDSVKVIVLHDSALIDLCQDHMDFGMDDLLPLVQEAFQTCGG